MSKRYTVTIPFCGALVLSGVEADNESDAIAKALESNLRVELTEIDSGELTLDDVEIAEWDVFRKIVSGNVFHGPLNDAFAEEES